MCYSATANFVGSGVIASVGIATLLRTRHPKELLFASLPVLFAVHQLVEGFVWLGLDGQLSQNTLNGAAAAYVLYAQALLPLVVPLSIWMLEPPGPRRRWLGAFVALGAVLGLYIAWALVAYDTSVFERGHSIVYQNPATEKGPLAIPYVLATCGAMLLSGYRYIVLFGIANVVGVIATMVVKAHAFTSVWCAYAAVASVVIYGYFHRVRAAERRRVA